MLQRRFECDWEEGVRTLNLTKVVMRADDGVACERATAVHDDCAASCGEHGACAAGRCMCDSGWSGPFCADVEEPLDAPGELAARASELAARHKARLTTSQGNFLAHRGNPPPHVWGR